VITPDITPSSARQVFQFEPNECVVGCIGAIRPYKNVPLLISCFRAIKDPTASLIIAGKCAIESHLAEIKAAIGDDPRIQTKFEILTDAEMQLFTMACDLIVLPYKDILNSGSLLYALSCNRRVLAPKLGSLPELQRDVGADWVNLYEGEFDQAVLENGLVWARSADLGNPNLADYEWNRIGEQTMEAYKSALAR
jgi:glycosyltransferase involved in cell wall biosynthesis